MLDLRDALRPGVLQAVVQPVVRFVDDQVVGYEALVRVPGGESPESLLARAHDAGCGVAVELACLRAATTLGSPPDGALLFVNLGPGVLEHPGLPEVVRSLPPRLVLEVTERQALPERARMAELLAPLLAGGARLAVDDTGSGYASLEHVVELRPEFLKLSSRLVSGLDRDPARLALVRALAAFAREVGASVVAEGVGREGERTALLAAGVEHAQGWLLARPGAPWPGLAARPAEAASVALPPEPGQGELAEALLQPQRRRGGDQAEPGSRRRLRPPLPGMSRCVHHPPSHHPLGSDVRISPVLSALALLASGLVLGAPPAAAHDDHSGWYIDSPTSQSDNLVREGEVSRTRPASTYRNSDLAFWGTTAYAGHYDGFQIVDLADPKAPRQLADVACQGSQHDVSTWDGLLFVSVEAPRSGPECSSTAQPPRTAGFEGIRIFDVSDPRTVSLVGSVATDCGSHTHTLLPDTARGRVLLYVSSYTASELPASPYGNECRRLDADGQRAHNKISVVEVPLAAPAEAKVVSEPRIPQNDFRSTVGFQGCHDITVSLPLKRAAAACMGEGQIWDISNPLAPVTVARVHNPNVEFFHSAVFSADGRTVVFGDEAGGGTQPRCREQDAATTGALWFYDLASLDSLSASEVEPWLSSYKVPRTQGNANCTMHNFNTLPMRGRNVLVSSAYAAGTTVVDFTNPKKPVELAHYDPHGANTWSSYWYNGRIITNDSGRGIDVLKLSETGRTAGAHTLPRLNPQTQEVLLRG